MANEDVVNTLVQASILDSFGVLYLGGDVTEEKSEELCKKILEYNILNDVVKQNDRLDRIQLIINSAGGFTVSGFAITEMMKWSKIPVYTTAIGHIASMAFIIFIAGAKGHRVITPTTSIMSHRFSWGTWGTHSDLIASRKEEDLLHERFVDHYLEHTSLKSRAKVEELLLKEHDVWLAPEEALKYGIADKIASPTKKTASRRRSKK